MLFRRIIVAAFVSLGAASTGHGQGISGKPADLTCANVDVCAPFAQATGDCKQFKFDFATTPYTAATKKNLCEYFHHMDWDSSSGVLRGYGAADLNCVNTSNTTCEVTPATTGRSCLENDVAETSPLYCNTCKKCVNSSEVGNDGSRMNCSWATTNTAFAKTAWNLQGVRRAAQVRFKLRRPLTLNGGNGEHIALYSQLHPRLHIGYQAALFRVGEDRYNLRIIQTWDDVTGVINEVQTAQGWNPVGSRIYGAYAFNPIVGTLLKAGEPGPYYPLPDGWLSSGYACSDTGAGGGSGKHVFGDCPTERGTNNRGLVTMPTVTLKTGQWYTLSITSRPSADRQGIVVTAKITSELIDSTGLCGTNCNQMTVETTFSANDEKSRRDQTFPPWTMKDPLTGKEVTTQERGAPYWAYDSNLTGKKMAATRMGFGAVMFGESTNWPIEYDDFSGVSCQNNSRNLNPSTAPTPTPVRTATPTPTVVPTPTPVTGASPTPTPVPTATPAPTLGPSSTPLPTPTLTVTPSPTPTRTPVPTPTLAPTRTPTPVPTATPTPVPGSSPTPTPQLVGLWFPWGWSPPGPTLAPGATPSPTPAPRGTPQFGLSKLAHQIGYAVDPWTQRAAYPSPAPFFDCSPNKVPDLPENQCSATNSRLMIPDDIVTGALNASSGAGCWMAEPSPYLWCARLSTAVSQSSPLVKNGVPNDDLLRAIPAFTDDRGSCGASTSAMLDRINLIKTTLGQSFSPSKILTAAYIFSWGNKTKAEGGFPQLFQGDRMQVPAGTTPQMSSFPLNWNPIANSDAPLEDYDYLDEQSADFLVACVDWWLYALKLQTPDVGRVMLQTSNGGGANRGPADSTVWSRLADVQKKHGFRTEFQVEVYDCPKAASQTKTCGMNRWTAYPSTYRYTDFLGAGARAWRSETMFPDCRTFNALATYPVDEIHAYGTSLLDRAYPSDNRIFTSQDATKRVDRVLEACPGSLAAKAQTWFVSAATGDDTNSGLSISAPFKTIQKAINAARARDRVFVRPGTYAEKLVFQYGAKTEDGRIYFYADPGKVTIDGTGLLTSRYDPLIYFAGAADGKGAHYVTLDGFKIVNSDGYGIQVSGNATHIELRNLDISNVKGDAAIFLKDESTTFPNAKFDRIANNHVHHNDGGGIVVWSARNGYIMVEANDVHDNAGVGNIDAIQVGSEDGSSHHVVVRRNKVWNNSPSTVYGLYADQIDVGGKFPGHHNLIEENDIYYTPDWVSAGYNLRPVKIHGKSTDTEETYAQVFRFNRLTHTQIEVYDHPNSTAFVNNTSIRGGIQFSSDCGQLDVAGCTINDRTYRSRSGQTMKFVNNLFWEGPPTPGRRYLINTYVGDNNYLNLSYDFSVDLFRNLWKFEQGSGRGICWNGADGCGFDGQTESSFRSWRNFTKGPVAALTSQEPLVAGESEFAHPMYLGIVPVLAESFPGAASMDYRPSSLAVTIDRGAALTKTRASGSNTRTIPVERASYFHDGWGGLLEPDFIEIVDSTGKRVTRRLARDGGVFDTPTAATGYNQTLTIAADDDTVSFGSGAAVSFPWAGNAPDIGAYEKP